MPDKKVIKTSKSISKGGNTKTINKDITKYPDGVKTGSVSVTKTKDGKTTGRVKTFSPDTKVIAMGNPNKLQKGIAKAYAALTPNSTHWKGTAVVLKTKVSKSKS
jgi:hypothetical protein